jgi:two-component system chemotaxis family response regulator WspR
VRLRVRNQIQIINQIRHIHEISTSDDLTGIGNRRFFCDQLDQEWNRAVRNRSRLSCMMIDINNFKRYNDLHGLLQGDRALKIVAQTVRSSLTRAVDKLARWGGDEFCVILPDTEPSGARSVAERIRKNVDMISIPLPDGSPSQTSVNIGVLSIFPTIKSGYVQMDLINDMEKALLQAKSTGQIFNIER